ncbi:hypothetical protein LguiA_025428 [Lonicera macranthoides]
MCAARNWIPIDDSAAKESVAAMLQDAYEWVKENLSLARLRPKCTWEKLEEKRAKELQDPSVSKRELLKRKKKQGSGNEGEILTDQAAEQAAVTRSQIHLFWGNMLFERSQVECKLGLTGWKNNLDTAVERFKLAGASEADISTVLKNHCSNGEAVEGEEKKSREFEHQCW